MSGCHPDDRMTSGIREFVVKDPATSGGGVFALGVLVMSGHCSDSSRCQLLLRWRGNVHKPDLMIMSVIGPLDLSPLRTIWA